MSVRAAAESSARREDGGWPLAVVNVVTPSRSFTTVSYCKRVMRGICEVAGMPGVQVHWPTQALALPVPPVPGLPPPVPGPPLLPPVLDAGGLLTAPEQLA